MAGAQPADLISWTFETLGYWARLALLTMFGPARLDDEHDPIAQLRRTHRQHHSKARWVG